MSSVTLSALSRHPIIVSEEFYRPTMHANYSRKSNTVRHIPPTSTTLREDAVSRYVTLLTLFECIAKPFREQRPGSLCVKRDVLVRLIEMLLFGAVVFVRNPF